MTMMDRDSLLERMQGDITVSRNDPAQKTYNIELLRGREQFTAEVMRMLAVIEGELGRRESKDRLGLSDEKHFRENCQRSSVALRIVEMTIPDKQRSPSQRHRLTKGGRTLLASAKEKN